jgi:PKHD-type hydroxylase|tara:strand:- start:31 stop:627 length:597 start_codon:yes stop_codon:yes gene_type:complete
MKKSKSSSWDFYLDKVYSYAFYEKAFTKEECEAIIKIAKNKGLYDSLIRKDKKDIKSEIRDSKICWLYPGDNMEGVFLRITDITLNINKKFFNFDLSGINEGLQFTNYKSPSGKYNKHVDRGLDLPIRKLSISIQLTDHNKYEGGELYIDNGVEGRIMMNKKQGTLIVFPSYTLHEVMPVTKGERNSLVTWVTGKQFK